MTLLANSIPFCNRRSSSALPSRDSARRCDLTPADFLQKRRVRGLRHFAAVGEQEIYLLDFTSGQVTAHFAAHGRSNGPHARATKFKGFQRDLNMVPLGPLKTVPAPPEVTDHYRTIVDRYDKTVYRNMIVGVLEGVASYNRYINHTPPYKWVIHPNWYTTAGYRAKNNGMLGRSLGCITVDPAENNKIIARLQGALIYVTVGDAPIEQYL